MYLPEVQNPTHRSSAVVCVVVLLTVAAVSLTVLAAVWEPVRWTTYAPAEGRCDVYPGNPNVWAAYCAYCVAFAESGCVADEYPDWRAMCADCLDN